MAGPTVRGRPGGRVVVAYDGSPTSRAAVAWALAGAARGGTGLEVVTVLPVQGTWGDADPLDPARLDLVRSEVTARVRDLLDGLREDPALAPAAASVRVTTTVLSGRPADELVHLAADAGLLVLGSRGRGVARSALLGSVALGCVTRAACPVVVVHPAVPAPRRARVVVGLADADADADAASEVLWRAAAEAHRMDAELEVVVACGVPEDWSDLAPAAAPVRAETLALATGRAEGVVREVLGARPDVRVVVAAGRPAEVLVRRAEGAALLVVGRRRRSRLAGMVLGSTALHCVVSAPCPVLVLHPQPVPAAVTV